jgi:hypothetical protein
MYKVYVYFEQRPPEYTNTTNIHSSGEYLSSPSYIYILTINWGKQFALRTQIFQLPVFHALTIPVKNQRMRWVRGAHDNFRSLATGSGFLSGFGPDLKGTVS